MALTDNLVGYWRLEGNGNDELGANSMAATNVTFGASYGKIGQGASLNGSNMLRCTSDTGARRSGHTFSFWFYVKGYFDYHVDQIFNGRLTDYTTRVFTHDYVSPTNALYFDGMGWSYNAGFTPSLNTWYHVALACNGTSTYVYFNGNLLTTQSNSTTGSYTPQMTFGTGNDSTGEPSNVNIDEVCVWSRCLSAAEVSSLYNGGSGMTIEINRFVPKIAFL